MIQIVIVGVGGQGTLLASKILGRLAIDKGYDVKVSEVHGMSQRGGSVITHVRIGENEPVYAPLVEQQGADFVVAFEQLEALRALPYLKKDGTIIVNTQKILPMTVITGAMQYPEDTLEKIKGGAARVIALDALSMANQLGDSRATNMIMLGVLAKQLPFAKQDWITATAACVPEKTIKLNETAFMAGYERED
jgi:indolepyruvate ferredoxin oxidoreductase beta subunit